MIAKHFLTAAAATVVVATAFLAGSVVTREAAGLRLPVARAASSLAVGSFAVCTAPIDMTTEGVFILDFETGDLSGGVLSSAGKFTTTYRYNVLKDLGFKPGQVKEPKFLLVPGRVAFSGNAGNRMAQAAIYVTDAGTGVTAAYGIPWNAQQATAGKPVSGELVLLDVARPRGGAGGAP
ncbi:MAG: hypothetical protein FJ284_01050 [Planctomycetes bacterium]|nr:hypothetical protein [Planctomycetota bacterium]